jgi:hypothetical protein
MLRAGAAGAGRGVGRASAAVHARVRRRGGRRALAPGALVPALTRAVDRAAGRSRRRRVPVRARAGALWLVCSLVLVAIFVTQEFLEGLFAAGHPAGLAGIFGYGGWWSIPAAVCVGLALAAVFEGASWVLREVADRHRGRPRPATRRRSPWPRISSIEGRSPVARPAALLLPIAELHLFARLRVRVLAARGR